MSRLGPGWEFDLIRTLLLDPVPGTGDQHPDAWDSVTVHYSGWTTDGNLFDSSVVRGEPTSFPLNRVIPGWTEGVQLMVVGEKRRFWIPEKLAYQGQPGRPAGMLVFDVELLGIEDAPAPPQAPVYVAAPPADALFGVGGPARRREATRLPARAALDMQAGSNRAGKLH